MYPRWRAENGRRNVRRDNFQVFVYTFFDYACMSGLFKARIHNDGPSLLPPIHFTVFEQHLRAATSQYLILNASGRSGILLPLVGHTNGRRKSTITKHQNFFISSTSSPPPSSSYGASAEDVYHATRLDTRWTLKTKKQPQNNKKKKKLSRQYGCVIDSFFLS